MQEGEEDEMELYTSHHYDTVIRLLYDQAIQSGMDPHEANRYVAEAIQRAHLEAANVGHKIDELRDAFWFNMKKESTHGLLELVYRRQRTGRASIKLTKEQAKLIYAALAFYTTYSLPLPVKVSLAPREVTLEGESVLRVMTNEGYDSSTRIAILRSMVEKLSIMMLIEEQIRDCQTWPCVVELDGYSWSAVSVALGGLEGRRHIDGGALLELNRATKKIVDDAITWRLSFTNTDAEAQGVTEEG